MNQMPCLRCKQMIDAQLEQCPHCGERVTQFQRTYSARLLDGKYQIIDRLGVGGMGEIFKVRHIHLNELRVIKIMRPNVAADDQGLQRFLQEARTSTMIKHKNLAMLYDFAQLEDGSYYMVWEFIDGTNIQRWINQNGPVPPRLTVEIAIQALNGLDHLHSMGLIHRDISPENIMLSQDHHGKLLVKVIDFGIAKQLAEGESGQGLTQTGMFLGKLKYASPEQAGFLKEGEHLDPRSDLYSFGIVLYEMLAGKAPFSATNPHGYILKHVTEAPPPLAVTNPDVKVPANLEAVVMRSLEKSRDARYETAADFAATLEGIRSTIAPDPKFGLGERMVTISSSQTLPDISKFGATGTLSPTMQRTASDAATVIERPPAMPTSSNAPTVIERQATMSGAPTVVERLGAGSTPTLVEAKGQWGGAEAAPTVVERKVSGPGAPKRNVGLIASIAAALVILVGFGAVYMFRRQEPPKQAAAPAAIPSSTQVTTSASAPGGPPLTPGQGALLLSASPWGDIEKIVDAGNQKPVAFPEDARSTPSRIELAPGKYLVTIAGPDGGTKTIDVSIEAGKRTPQHVDLGVVDVEDIVKEMNP